MIYVLGLLNQEVIDWMEHVARTKEIINTLN
jgi:hypothetical protein